MLFGHILALVAIAAFGWLLVEVRSLNRQVNIMSQAFDNLKAAVAAQTAVNASALTLIQGISDKLRSAGSDADLQALADELNAAAKPLADAVAANTPAAPASEPAPDQGGAPV